MTRQEMINIERDAAADVALWKAGKLDWKDFAPDVGAKLEAMRE